MSEETRRSSEDAALFPWLNRHSLGASVFFSGRLCGTQDYVGRNGGHLHLVRRGPVELRAAGQPPLRIARPSLILFARATGHRIDADEAAGADLICAQLAFDSPEAELLLLGFPDLLVIALDDLDGLAPVLQRLFDEAFSEDFGQRAAVDLLIELLLIMLLRHCIARGTLERGLLAGLSEPRLARALSAMHGAPERALNLERLAEIAGMSRSTFAAAFKARVGVSPGDYLTTLRLALAKQALLAGRPLKAVAAEAGYASPTALARAFQRQFGLAPRDWLAQRAMPAKMVRTPSP
ncbi:AraC family transcriptional regulator [Pelagibius sp. 7325]|uniref:AraC family transcriptional regulator n=1 Tax=Pelagibius sp. 7325 TaxID=3131994 RepID=UPI0030EE4CF3